MLQPHNSGPGIHVKLNNHSGILSAQLPTGSLLSLTKVICERSMITFAAFREFAGIDEALFDAGGMCTIDTGNGGLVVVVVVTARVMRAGIVKLN